MNISGNQSAGDLPVYPYATSGEHSTVTIMFVDVVDSTRIFENIDPEYVHQIMVGCFDILLDEVHKNQGSINQFRGDSIMALFAATTAQDNQALCACQAALGVIRAIKAYGHGVHGKYSIPFQVRIGLHTGPVTIGTVGAQLQGDFVADCDTTRLASLLESRAHPGTILISDRTAERVDSFFNLRLRSRINNKTGARPIRGFELADLKASGHIPYSGVSGPLQPYTPRHLADRILITRSSIEGERKYITVMFVGIADNAALSENRAPEQVNRIIDDCFQILRNQIYSFGGVINQYRGDFVMALFGAPIAHEDHAARACHAALTIMRAIRDYRTELEKECSIPLALRIGLNTGKVVAGSIGNEARRDYTADGDTSNLAARLCARADPGAILVSSNTCQRIRQLFRLNSLGSDSVKGRKETITVYTLLGEKAYRPRLGLERLIYSAMVGRESELETLEKHLQKLLDGTGAVINITGEAGIGKSRLVAELLKLDIINQATVLEGKAISIGSSLSYYPLIDLLQNWVGIIREDDQGAAFDKLEAAVLELHSAQGSDIIPFIATLMGMELSGQYARRVQGIAGESLENLIFR
ncbi:MAG: adenylate/guanylate cyclase domain-containing protein, partial [Desulfocapsaceae bacterium]|nr:adenylate/guanylate cyclase domain-containing protein [Desulfocapsaceae bacterium]